MKLVVGSRIAENSENPVLGPIGMFDGQGFSFLNTQMIERKDRELICFARKNGGSRLLRSFRAAGRPGAIGSAPHL